MRELNWQKDVSASLEILKNSSFINPSLYQTYSKIYDIADLNHKDLFLKLKTKQKRYLGVCGSTSPMLNAICIGFKNVTVFDINVLNIHYMFLHIASLLSLSQKEYIDYFYSRDPEKRMAKYYFEKVKTELPHESFLYWKTLYEQCKDSLTNLFYYGTLQEEDYQIIEKVNLPANLFLQNNQYSKLQEQLRKIHLNYLITDFSSLPIYLKNQQYDFMYFCNMHNYLTDSYWDILKEMESFLAFHGVLQGGFIYWYEYEQRYEDKWYLYLLQQLIENGYKKVFLQHVPGKEELQDMALVKVKE